MRPTPSARLVLAVSLISLGNFACKPSEPTPDGGACSTAADCTGEVSACTENACVSGACRVQPKPAGARLEAQVTGDCRVAVCNGNGGVTSSVDDTDVLVDGLECTRDVCTQGTPSNPPVAADTACGMNGALTCNGQGQCVTCLTADDCSMGTECQVRTCTAGVCGFDNVATGTRVAAQTAGDCQVSQCDGQGAVQTVADNADLPVDGVECTRDLCTAGVPSNPPVTVGTTCTENNGSRCDAAGACVQCVMAADCPGIDTECQVRTCTAGVCGRSYTMDGTAVSSQTANDCRKSVCDGQGRVVVRNDDTDLPNDNNACTTDTCSAGTRVFTNRASGDSCGTQLICDGAGACVGCNTAADCPGTDTACGVRTCVNNVCGRNDVAANTPAPASAQTPNNCRVIMCDGNGNLENQNDDTDLPADDGQECTASTCTNGVGSHTPRAQNTACSQNGGAFCNATGACVQCNQPAQCAGTDGECSTRTCVSGACGVSFVQAGTPTAAATQTAGDCRQRQCAGDGGVVLANLDSDLPVDDNNPCTSQSCSNGQPVVTPLAIDTACSANGGTRCNATGTCVQCNTPTQCAGEDNACQTRTCSASGACGFNYVAAGTPTPAQVTGDCREARCSGDGGIVQANLDTDPPADDGNQCTQQSCSNGAPSFPAVTPGATCSQNGGAVCSGTACVECRFASDCPGTDTECQSRTCTNNVCGIAFAPSTTVVAQQTAGDCQQNRCDGAGQVVSVAFDADLPTDTNQCTTEACSNGSPAIAPVNPGTACNQNGGTLCSGTSCVQCLQASDCPGQDDECKTRTCNAGSCGFSYTAAGTPVAAQTAGDCRRNECDGSGAIVVSNFDGDLPAADTNECTQSACTNGTPAQVAVTPGTSCTQNGGTFCSGTTCVSCSTGADCPGTDNECSARVCNSGTCGRNILLAAGTPVSGQTAGDCQRLECDAAGAIVSVAFNSDLPADDSNECTNEQCTAGVPSRPFAVADTSCGTNGTQFCNPTGQCVACNVATQCAGADTACQTRTCSAAGACGFDYQPAGTQLASQTPGDCKVEQCNGAGVIETVNADTDVPVDSNACTDDVCTSGVPSNPNSAQDTACNQNGGSFCDGDGACVQCNLASQCPAGANECQVRACTNKACGFTNVAVGTPTQSQTAGDCKQGECDGNGNIVSANLDTDLPVDSSECTANVCTAGTPSNPPVALGISCSQNGGDACNGAGACVASPVIVSVAPANGVSAVSVRNNIVITFNKAMNPMTLTMQATSDTCFGSVQLSRDNFASCLGLANAALTGNGTILTVTPSPGLAYGTNYKVRVTTAVQDTLGLPMRNQFSMADGFTTATDVAEGVVISQVYAAGGNTSAVFTHDFVELHNRGSTAVSLQGWSIQYASAASTFSGATALSGTIAPGGYYLVQLAGGAVGSPLPTPNATGTLNMGGSGKVALVSNTTLLSSACPPASAYVDFVGWGTANCFEGFAAVGAQSSANGVVRNFNGCAETNDNSQDFSVLPPAPRNGSTAVVMCPPSTVNESNLGGELDFCNVQSPTSLALAPSATAIVYAQAYEAGSTEAGGAATNLRAQIGYGPSTANPQWQSGWRWFNGTYNTNAGNNDEWQATITAPSTAGSYRYSARFSYDGVSWTYCDLNGAGSNFGLSFETAQLPTLTVQ